MNAPTASPSSEAAARQTRVSAAFEGELALLQPDTRRSAERLRALLAPEFREIGASGRVYERDTIIEALTSEEALPAPPDPHVSELTAECVGDDLVLLTYRLEFSSRTTRRSSLWRVTSDGAALIFHQGTPSA